MLLFLSLLRHAIQVVNYEIKKDGGTSYLYISGDGEVEKTKTESFKSQTIVVIEPGITKIGDDSLSVFTSLVNVTFLEGSKCTSFGRNGFKSSGRVNLTLVIPPSVTEIGESCFEGVSMLNLEIPNSVTTLGNAAFKRARIHNFTFQSGSKITNIPSECFSIFRTSDLVLPKSIKSITSGEIELPFWNARLNSIRFESGSTMDKIGQYMFNGIIVDKFYIPSTVKSLDINSFSSAQFHQTLIKEVLFEENSQCTSFGNMAFYRSPISNITIPSSVVSLGNSCFESTYLRTVHLILHGTNLKTIGSNCFKNVQMLNFTLPKSVTTLGNGVFSGSYIERFEFEDSPEGSNLELPDGAFEGFKTKNDIILPQRVTKLGNRCFAEAHIEFSNSHIKIIIGEKIISIGNECFYKVRMDNLTLPKSLTTIGSGAFKEANIDTFVFKDVRINRLESGTFEGFTTTSSLTIPSSVSFIGSNVFKSSTLQSLNFASGSTITSFNAGVFGGATVDTLTIPASITTITGEVFTNANIKNIKFEEGSAISSLGDRAFFDVSFTSITLPTSIKSLGSYCFARSSFTTIKYTINLSEGLSTIGEYCFNNANLNSLTIPSSVTTLCYGAFSGSKFDAVSFSTNAKITELNNSVFENSTILSDITIPKSVIRLGSRCFYGVKNSISSKTSLKSNELSIKFETNSALREISDNCFGDTAINQFIFPSNVKTLGAGIFNRSTVKGFSFGDSSLTKLDDYSFSGATLDSLTLPNSLTTLGEGVFKGSNIEIFSYGSSHITTIPKGTFDSFTSGNDFSTVPSTVIKLESESFKGVILESFKIPSSIKELGTGVFMDSNIKTLLFDFNFQLTELPNSTFERITTVNSITIPNSVTKLGSRCFYNVKKIQIGYSSNLNEIGDYCFGNSVFDSFLLPNSIIKLGIGVFKDAYLGELVFDKNSKISILSDSLFEGLTVSKLITIPESVKIIGNRCFYNLKKPPFNVVDINIILPSGLESIGNSAFENSDIPYIEIKDNVISLGQNCFSRSQIQIVKLGKLINNLGNGCFGQCAKLKIIYYNGSTDFSTRDKSEVFDGVNPDTVYVTELYPSDIFFGFTVVKEIIPTTIPTTSQTTVPTTKPTTPPTSEPTSDPTFEPTSYTQNPTNNPFTSSETNDDSNSDDGSSTASNSKVAVVGATTGSIVGIAALCCIGFLFFRRRRARKDVSYGEFQTTHDINVEENNFKPTDNLNTDDTTSSKL